MEFFQTKARSLGLYLGLMWVAGAQLLGTSSTAFTATPAESVVEQTGLKPGFGNGMLPCWLKLNHKASPVCSHLKFLFIERILMTQ